MVLRPNVVRNRIAANSENTPPTVVKTRANRVRTSFDQSRKQRRTRTTDAASTLRTPRYLAEQAKRKDAKKSKPGSSAPQAIRFELVTSSSSSADVEMKDAPPITFPMSFPRQLDRPEYREVSPKAIAAVSPDLANLPIQYVRDALEDMGPAMLAAISSVRAIYNRDRLPAELPIDIPDKNAVPPTHLLAVHTSRPLRNAARPVTLFPVHSVYLAAYCSNLPVFKPVKESAQSSLDDPIMVPTIPLSIPSPETFQFLVIYMYTKRTTMLLNSLLPMPAPQNLEENQKEQIPPFATLMGRTYTTEAILSKIFLLRDMWYNVIALGIFDDGVWDTIDLAWDILLTALAVSSGKPHLMISSVSVVP